MFHCNILASIFYSLQRLSINYIEFPKYPFECFCFLWEINRIDTEEDWSSTTDSQIKLKSKVIVADVHIFQTVKIIENEFQTPTLRTKFASICEFLYS